jgi:transcriptional regulator with XRE-family HTH domain
MEQFAENLKKYRTLKEISQEELAKKAGVHSTHLSRYERMLSIPSLEVAYKIAKALDVSIDELVHGSNQSQKMEQSIKDRELLGMFKKVQVLNDKQKECMKEFMSAFLLKADVQKNLASA